MGNTFRNTSGASQYGQYDIRPSITAITNLVGGLTDSAGEFETFPIGHEKCEFDINDEVCGAVDGAGLLRADLNANRDLYSELERMNLYAYLNHEFDSGMEAFGEFLWYWSDTNTIRHSSTALSAVNDERMAADNPYNPFGICGSPGRLDEVFMEMNITIPCTGLELQMENYRYEYAPRIVDVDGDVSRLVGGLRGTSGDWDWEGALTWSQAARLDVTHNRISNTLLREGLEDTTAAAINPFSPTIEGSNISRALVDVFRDSENALLMVDFKMSNPALFEMATGPAAALVGFEYRDESFTDDRDPRLDGTIRFVDYAPNNNTFPFVSDVMNSSPTSDGAGDRQVTSLFGELQIPLLETLDMQFALRYEDFSDVGSTTVGKIALGWRPVDQVLLRGSWSEAYRVPNLITINEATVSRSNTRNDLLCFVLEPEPDANDERVHDDDCRYQMQRTVEGTRTLIPETSDNYNFGLVIEPSDNLTFTIDYWGIEKDNTVGLFGEENHIALDVLMRIQAGDNDCSSPVGNPAVVRQNIMDADDSMARAALFNTAGICPTGDVIRVDDAYANLDTRTVEGYDIGIHWEADLGGGVFGFRYTGTWLDEYTQEATGEAAVLAAAQADGTLSDAVPVVGFADLKGINGRPEHKRTMRFSYDYGSWRVAFVSLYYDSFIQLLAGTLAAGVPREFPIDSMETYNLSIDYNFTLGGQDSRLRFGANNFTDERAPLADDSFGYFADQHRDLGSYYYLDFSVRVF